LSAIIYDKRALSSGPCSGVYSEVLQLLRRVPLTVTRFAAANGRADATVLALQPTLSLTGLT